ncbi:hypothetical protein ACA910_012903 [Epithemia clementina (nom. ined.)]
MSEQNQETKEEPSQDEEAQPEPEQKPEPSEPSADEPQQQQTTQPSASSVNLPPATGVVWRLQYVPTVVFGDGTSAASIPTGFPASSLPTSAITTENASIIDATAAGSPPATSDASAAGKGKDGAIPISFVGPSHLGERHPPQGQVATMVQIQTADGQTPSSFPPHAYLVAPPNFAASLGAAPGQNITITLPSGPQARVSNDPNNAFFTLDLTEDNTDLPLPLEEEVDLSSYSYKINLGKDVVSGKGGKVQQLNRHFRNMVAAAYPTYDSTTSKISKRKIGLKIYQAIIDRGGKFLDLDGNPMDRPKSILKVMKALKDAKTWTSDAKRQAKRKREEARTIGEKDAKKQHIAEPKQDSPPSVEAQAMVIEAAGIKAEESAAVADNKPHEENELVKPNPVASPGSPNSSLLEKRGQSLPTQKLKKKDSPVNDSETSATVADGNDVEATVPSEIPQAKVAQDAEQEQDESAKQELETQEQLLVKQEQSELEQAALAAAAAAAAASLETTDVGNVNEEASGELANGEQEASGEKASQAVLQGLQLLTKAAANARDTNEKPETADV